jgi:peptidoglycan glycosyltransferase
VLFAREINRVLVGALLALTVIGASAFYWAVVGPDTILRRDDNPRLFLAEAALQRGRIYDRHDVLLADTLVSEAGTARRIYPEPAVNSVLGYASLRYGTSGVEDAYNVILRGDDLPADFTNILTAQLLHRPQRGSDIRLTLDLQVQSALAQAMGEQHGAAVVLSVPDGDVLALISLPTFDPNRLDADWDRLRDHPDDPFFNRVLQGRYQPGGTLQTPLMAAAILYNMALDQPLEGATAPVELNGLTLGCAVRLPPLNLSLREAYGFACPRPFADLGEALGTAALQATLDTFRLNRPPHNLFAGMTGQTDVVPPYPVGEDALIENALGQSELLVNPLNMAMMAAAIANDGNSPQPYLLMSRRAPDESDWSAISIGRPTIPFMTSATARQLQDLMRNAVVNGAAFNAGRPGIDIGGHAALAYAGDRVLSWFVGFATLGGRQGLAVAVVLENTDDPGLAADIGGAALAAAQNAAQVAAAETSTALP